MVVSVVLGASLAVNVYLLLEKNAAKQSVSRRVGAAASPKPSLAAGGRALSPVVRAARQRYVDLDRETIELRLVEAEAKVNSLLPEDQRFELEMPVPENDERVQPFFDKVFGGRDKYELECRETVCRLLPERGANDNWMMAMQSDPDGFLMFEAQMFAAGESFVTLMESDRAAGRRLLMTVTSKLRASDALARCKKEHASTPGMVGVELEFDEQARKIVVVAKRNPPMQAAIDCVQRAAEDIVATTIVPSDIVRAAPIRMPISIP